MPTTDQLDKLLHSHGLRLTRPRQLVFDFMQHQHEPTKLGQVIGLAGNWADRASLYRTVKLFKELGILTEVHRPGGDWLELGEAFSPHHHHLTCINCGLSQTLESPPIEQKIEELARQARFRPSRHHLEITGLCQECLTASRNQ